MLDIPSISSIVAAAGVMVGVAFTALQLRDLVKTRQTDLVIRLYSTFGGKEYLEAYRRVMSLNIEEYDEYLKKYGASDIIQVSTLFEGIGVLLYRRLIDIELVDQLFSEPVGMAWEKMHPMIERSRKRFNRPRINEWFEYLAKELQRKDAKTTPRTEL